MYTENPATMAGFSVYKKSPLRGSFPSLAYLFYLHPKPLLLELVPGTNRPTPGT